MACDYTYGKVTSNRARDLYYPANIIASDNIEIADLYSNSKDLQSQDIESYLKDKDLKYLDQNNIEYILFSASCADRTNYLYLDEEINEYEKIFNGQNVKIYKIIYEE
jgi:hypothetical protein